MFARASVDCVAKLDDLKLACAKTLHHHCRPSYPGGRLYRNLPCSLVPTTIRFQIYVLRPLVLYLIALLECRTVGRLCLACPRPHIGPTLMVSSPTSSFTSSQPRLHSHLCRRALQLLAHVDVQPHTDHGNENCLRRLVYSFWSSILRIDK